MLFVSALLQLLFFLYIVNWDNVMKCLYHLAKHVAPLGRVVHHFLHRARSRSIPSSLKILPLDFLLGFLPAFIRVVFPVKFENN